MPSHLDFWMVFKKRGVNQLSVDDVMGVYTEGFSSRQLFCAVWDWAAQILSFGLRKFSRSPTPWGTIHSEDRPGRRHLSWTLDLPQVLHLDHEDVLGQDRKQKYDDMRKNGWERRESQLLRPDLLSLKEGGGNLQNLQIRTSQPTETRVSQRTPCLRQQIKCTQLGPGCIPKDNPLRMPMIVIRLCLLRTEITYSLIFLELLL